MARFDETEGDLNVLSQALHERYDAVLDEAVPERLLRAARPRLRRFALAAGWVVLGAAVGVVTGWQLHSARQAPVVQAQGEVGAFVRRAAVAHATYSPEVRHPVEVAADQEAHLVAWLSKRLGATVRAPKLDSVGYSLVGGRLLPGDAGRPVAQFMYQCKQGTRITLYVRTDARNSGDTAFRFSSEGNVRVFYWIDRSFGYAVSSADVSKDTLLKVATAAYGQLNP
ncbi:MAG: anti-sigma factor [Burkholderiales bacterium]